MSKMTIIEEKNNGPLEYTHIKMVEFLEFIGRLSYYFFETTSQHLEWQLHQKIEVILGQMLAAVELKMEVPWAAEHAHISDSDDEYWRSHQLL